MRARRAGSSGYSMPDRRVRRPSRAESFFFSSREKSPPGGGDGRGVFWAALWGEPVCSRARWVGARAFGPAAAAVGQRGAKADELRQVLVERAEAVMYPRADGRQRPLEGVPAGVELQLGAVVVVGGPQGTDHGNVVDAVADVRPPVADLDAAL